MEVVTSNCTGKARMRIEFGISRERQQTEPVVRKWFGTKLVLGI